MFIFSLVFKRLIKTFRPTKQYVNNHTCTPTSQLKKWNIFVNTCSSYLFTLIEYSIAVNGNTTICLCTFCCDRYLSVPQFFILINNVVLNIHTSIHLNTDEQA